MERILNHLKIFPILSHPWLLIKIPPWFGEHHYLRLFFEVVHRDQYHAKEYIKKGSIVIDAGANVGIFANFAAHLGASVYAFEPTSRGFEILRRNASKNVFPVKNGLGEISETKNIFASNFIECSTFEGSGMAPVPGSKVEKVEITTIDDFVKENKLKKVDFIKIDTEGYEKQILEGAKDTIKRFRPVIAMSAYHHPEDKKVLPATVNAMAPYNVDLSVRCEEDFICTPK